MKKNYLWKLLVLFAGVLAIGCNRDLEPTEELNPEQNVVELVTEAISAVADEGSTKVQIAESGAAFSWSEADKVAVHTTDGWYLSEGLSDTYQGVTEATFTVTYSGDRNAFAIFPYTLVYDTSADDFYANSKSADGSGSNNLTVNLPSSYALTDVSGDKAPCPMIATNTGSSWNFKHLCGLLRLTINGIPTDATTLTLDFLGRKMSGAFTIENGNLVPGNASCVIASDSGADKITITGLDNVTSVTVNIPLPTGGYDDIVVTSNSSTKLMAIRHIKAPEYIAAANPDLYVYTANRAHRRKLTTTLVSFTVNNESKKVAFSPANLRATVTAVSAGIPTAVSWSFNEQHPRDALWNVNKSKAYSTFSVGTIINMFGWGTSGWASSGVASWVNYQPWSITTDNLSGETYKYNQNGYGPDSNCYRAYGDDGWEEEWASNAASQKGLWGEYANGDWGVYNQIGSYPAGTWRTPRALEWNYLLNTRTVSNSLSTDARYVLLQCDEDPDGGDRNWEQYLVIFPDNYVHPEGVDITGDPVYNSPSAFTGYVATYSDLDKMEAAGAVLLFVVGERVGASYYPFGTIGRYWSSDAELWPIGPVSGDNPKGEATCLKFGDQVVGSYGRTRKTGTAVRLIHDIN